MNSGQVFFYVIIAVAALGLIAFLVFRNKKDEKELNPDAPDAVEETHTEQETDKTKT